MKLEKYGLLRTIEISQRPLVTKISASSISRLERNTYYSNKVSAPIANSHWRTEYRLCPFSIILSSIFNTTMADHIPSPQPIPKQKTLWITPGHHKHIQLRRSLALDHSSHQNPSWTYLRSKLIWLFYMNLPNSRTRWRNFEKGRSHKCQRISREDGLGS